MKYSRSVALTAVLGIVLLAAGGCASYYQVKDPASGSTYYTNEVDDVKGGAVKFKDQRTGSTITIQNSEVKQIDSDAFEKGLKAPEQKKPAPVQPN
jgi:hypothetical protein